MSDEFTEKRCEKEIRNRFSLGKDEYSRIETLRTRLEDFADSLHEEGFQWWEIGASFNGNSRVIGHLIQTGNLTEQNTTMKI